ncbi:hypothetical protein K469DRAFT_732436 [Zopfia rhizophila CBS 207.26]|uniref:Fungal N-terminal domain-containing protein n=1 Tax=Zopfia rhizophila CBS 207.26 TaxID=1314779 RepID=A0A6A6DGB0_9PEZI|nr:hypothetical protein K469DRAFT_732436 [Zopfia rhizophila CBS 207.26]
MEAAAAVVSFVSLAGPVAQGLKFLYDFTTDMKDCLKDIREMKTDLELVEDLITIKDLKKELTAYLVDGKRKASLDRIKTIMFNDLLYNICDTNQEVLRSVKKINRNLETYNRNFHKSRVETSVQLVSDILSEGLTDIKIMAKKLEHITDLLTEIRILSLLTLILSTPALSREVSDISVMNSSQETTASSISSSPSIPWSVSQNA